MPPWQRLNTFESPFPPLVSALSGAGKLGRVVPRLRGTDSADLVSRQLRRFTLDALRLLHHRASRPGVKSGRVLAVGLKRDARLIAAISDVLLGQAPRPEPLERSLPRLCGSIVALLSDVGQVIALDVRAGGRCPDAPRDSGTLRDTVLRVAHELVGNAVRHGMHAHASGRIEVRLRAGSAGTAFTVLDDGRGCATSTSLGESLSLAALELPHGAS